VLVLVLAVGGCHGDPTSAPTPSPPSGEQDGLLARPSANPAVVTEMIGREPPGVVLCAIDLLGHSEGEQYAWLMCGDYRTGPEAELLSASAEAVVIRGTPSSSPGRPTSTRTTTGCFRRTWRARSATATWR
jgi:hypothetical protein